MDMKLKDMKMPAKKAMGMDSPMAGSLKGKMYPWGMSINLDSAALERLGIKDLPEAGEEVEIHAMGKITRVEQSANDGKKSGSIAIQITHMGLACGDDSENEKTWDKVKKDRRK